MSQNQVTSSLISNTNGDINQMDDPEGKNGMKGESKKDGATFIVRQHGDKNKIRNNINDGDNDDENDDDDDDDTDDDNSSIDGVLTVKINGMGSFASLTSVDIPEGTLDRVNTRNSSERTSSPNVVSVFSSVSGGIFGPTLGSQNAPIISNCVSKKCASSVPVPVPVHFEDLGSAFTSDLMDKEEEVGVGEDEDEVCESTWGDVNNNSDSVNNANNIDDNVIDNNRNSNDIQGIEEISDSEDSAIETLSIIDSRSRSRSEVKVEEQGEEQSNSTSRSPSSSPVFIEVSQILFNFNIVYSISRENYDNSFLVQAISFTEFSIFLYY